MPSLLSLAPDERPREKLLERGTRSLTDAELLAIILQQGSGGASALELARRMLGSDTLTSLSSRRGSYFLQENGIGQAKACKLLACFEIGRRIASATDTHRVIVDNAADIADILIPEMSILGREEFRCVFLDARRSIIAFETVFVGSLNQTVVHPREIFRAAIEIGAAAVILVHNHPSGDPTPSDADIAITDQILDAGDILGIEVLDHIIIGSDSYSSFRDQDILFG